MIAADFHGIVLQITSSHYFAISVEKKGLLAREFNRVFTILETKVTVIENAPEGEYVDLQTCIH